MHSSSHCISPSTTRPFMLPIDRAATSANAIFPHTSSLHEDFNSMHQCTGYCSKFLSNELAYLMFDLSNQCYPYLPFPSLLYHLLSIPSSLCWTPRYALLIWYSVLFYHKWVWTCNALGSHIISLFDRAFLTKYLFFTTINRYSSLTSCGWQYWSCYYLVS